MTSKKTLAVLAILVLAIILLASFAITIIQSSNMVSTITQNVPVGTFLYLWYGFNTTSLKWTGGLGTSHWNDSEGNVVMDTPDVTIDGTHFYPSLNNDTLAWQLSNMQQAGISIIIVSWWGSGNTTQSGGSDIIMDRAIDNATLNLFKYLEATKNRWHFQVAIMIDAYYNYAVYHMTPNDWAHVYGYLYTRYYHPYSDLIYNWQGKPLVLFFNTPWMNNASVTAHQVPQNSTFTVRLVGSPPNQVNWSFWEGDGYLTASIGTQPWNYEHSPQISTDGEVDLIWRYDDYYQRPKAYMRFDPNGTLGLWNYEANFAVSNAGSIKLILLDSWNEYHARTAFEPHTDVTAPNFNGTQDISKLIQRLPSAPKVLMVAEYALAVILVAAVISVTAIRWKRRRNETKPQNAVNLRGSGSTCLSRLSWT
jgi:hypothetical protein